MLVDYEIKELIRTCRVEIKPPPMAIEGTSIDLTLGNSFAFYQSRAARDPDCGCIKGDLNILYPNSENEAVEFTAEALELEPGETILATTEQYIRLPDDITGVLGGTSSLARLFVLAHVTAPKINPGFDGQITLELVNLNSNAKVSLYAGMKIATLTLFQHKTCETPYRGKYNGQTGATPVRVCSDLRQDVGDLGGVSS